MSFQRIVDAQDKIFKENLPIELDTALETKHKGTALFKEGDIMGAVDSYALAVA